MLKTSPHKTGLAEGEYNKLRTEREGMCTDTLYKLRRHLFNYGPLRRLFATQRIHSRPSNCCGCRETLLHSNDPGTEKHSRFIDFYAALLYTAPDMPVLSFTDIERYWRISECSRLGNWPLLGQMFSPGIKMCFG